MLRSALESGIGPLNELEREGVIQRFEYTFELAWNTLKDRLEYDGIAFRSVTPRSIIRQAYQSGLIQNGETWLDMLTDRNLMSHTYDADRFEAIVTNVHDRYLSLLNDLYLRLLEVTVEKGPLNGEGTHISSEVMAALQAVFACYPELTEVLLYGSRATQLHARTSTSRPVESSTLTGSDGWLWTWRAQTSRRSATSRHTSTSTTRL